MKYTLTSLFTLFIIFSNAQTIDWWNSFGASSDEQVMKVEQDSKGNIIVMGTYDQIFDIDDETLVIEGGQEFFLAKFDKTGKTLWARSFTGVGPDMGADFFVDTDDVIYLAAIFDSKVRINNEAIFAEGGIDGLVMQITPAGFNGWIKNMGGDGIQTARSIWVDATDVYVVGDFSGTGTFDNFIVESAGGTDMWITRIEKTEAVTQWVITFGGTGDDSFHALVKDFRNDLYVVGSFSGSFSFGNQAISATSGKDVFIGKLSTLGVPIWVKTAVGNYDGNEALNLDVDIEANIYLSGVFGNTLTVDNDTILNAGTDSDGFLLSYNANGGFRWGQSIATSAAGRINGLKQWNNNIYVAGTTQNGTLFGTEVVNDAKGSMAFLAGFDLNGKLLRLGRFDSNGDDEGVDLTGINESITMVGTFEQSLDFDGETATSTGGKDIFVARIDATTLVTDTDEPFENTKLDFQIDQYNKSLRVFLPEILLKNKGAIQVFNAEGKLIREREALFETQLDLSTVTSGVYFLQWTDGRHRVSSSFVLF